jgi:hypothetical protein
MEGLIFGTAFYLAIIGAGVIAHRVVKRMWERRTGERWEM